MSTLDNLVPHNHHLHFHPSGPSARPFGRMGSMEVNKVMASWYCAHPDIPPLVDETLEASQQLAKQVFRDWDRLHAILERHETLIRRRWKEKTKFQPQGILLDTWPT
ncbi:hypothetical protein K504DRAFT_500359 [Pleomassaria siparia CBS 279.74]|uniref:Uncharacterized protein n=1 Tax=Pleomassaria siparia CBS 279.74 TaxID=1314801 RepID=A0A6G1KFV1_9PLEO|nr:hypothetical protein K504DRAFT_500359 [Pleomassaria siparia CBS 279.74]